MKEKKREPYNKFKGFLREKGLRYEDVARTLGRSPASIAEKINGKSDFYLSEIKVLRNTYDMPLEIFL